MKRVVDAARTVAFRTLRQVTAEGAYANLELRHQLAAAGLPARDAAFVTELVNGTCRLMGTYDAIIAAAGGRPISSLQPAVVDVVRLGAHQVLSMRVPIHAAVDSSVNLAALKIGERVAGLVNAVLRNVAARPLDAWLDLLCQGLASRDALALRHHHPRWIVDAFAEVLPTAELDAELAANNATPRVNLVIRPGLAEVAELGGEPNRYSPFGAHAVTDPSTIPAVRQGRAGVQDEGSQLMALALSRVDTRPDGPWLDLCAGPGGKAALLAGLAAQRGTAFVASELQPHRADLVRQALRAYPPPHPHVIVADGTNPPWVPGTFARVMADVPCTGLGALRRRPEARWRRTPDDVDDLAGLQRDLLRQAIRSTLPGGVVAYVTCSPHRAETALVVADVLAEGGATLLPAGEYLPEVPDATVGDFVQLWPHRHGTDAMFLALLRRH